MNIGIGRFPVRTVSEATIAVDKVISYMNNDGTGAWKNNVCFVADDGSNADTFDTVHQDDANATADLIEKSKYFLMLIKRVPLEDKQLIRM